MRESSDEDVRLLVWDLDDTFWRGKLDEGGPVESVPENLALVLELSERGIINSICSKNDFENVQRQLQVFGIWEYFVFPSVDWTAKGPRLNELIDAIGLRPCSVAFVDDEPRNRIEAKTFSPQIQILSPEKLPTILSDPRFRGKPDPQLTRLRQYALLERRARDFKKSEEGPIEFLRNSDIAVTIDCDIVPHLDRVVELINRTNQLNFTKKRLSEDLVSARSELLELIDQFCVQSGVIHVRDRYGDYGVCGLYVKVGTERDARLEHFCFSCRIIGMGIEKWLFDRLGRPRLNVVMDEIFGNQPIDWIRHSIRTIASSDSNVANRSHLSPIRIIGGCELDPLAHYFRLDGHEVKALTNFAANGQFIRYDTSATLANLLDPSEVQTEKLRLFGVERSEYYKVFFSKTEPYAVWFISTWGDISAPAYRHDELDMTIPFDICELQEDLSTISHSLLSAHFERLEISPNSRSRLFRAVTELKNGWHFCKGVNEAAVFRQLGALILAIPTKHRIVFLLPHRARRCEREGLVERPEAVRYRTLLKTLARSFGNVELLDLEDCVISVEEMSFGYDHFARIVYLRLYAEANRCSFE